MNYYFTLRLGTDTDLMNQFKSDSQALDSIKFRLGYI